MRGAVGHMLRVLLDNLETKSKTYKNKVHCLQQPPTTITPTSCNDMERISYEGDMHLLC